MPRFSCPNIFAHAVAKWISHLRPHTNSISLRESQRKRKWKQERFRLPRKPTVFPPCSKGHESLKTTRVLKCSLRYKQFLQMSSRQVLHVNRSGDKNSAEGLTLRANAWNVTEFFNSLRWPIYVHFQLSWCNQITLLPGYRRSTIVYLETFTLCLTTSYQDRTMTFTETKPQSSQGRSLRQHS